ncbi:lipopolysaccharide biosynthesis protein [Streptomyces sp. NPDC057702]|uniref:lipopolysaccharide biosynthesis protein n=1 Tax=unclassified Streptomyces TaxID=2593676 RepID=UPI00368AE56E
MSTRPATPSAPTDVTTPTTPTDTAAPTASIAPTAPAAPADPASESVEGDARVAHRVEEGSRGRRRRPWRGARSRLPGWWPVALGAALGLAGGAAYGVFTAPEYTATSYVVAVARDGTDPATALGFAQAYGRITTGGAVLSAAQRATGTPVDALRASVRTATSPDAPMIEVTGADARAGRAATTANAVARALTEHANRSTPSTGVRLTVFAQAVPPTAPTSPSLPISLAVGGCAGGLLGSLALLVRPRPAPGPHRTPGVGDPPCAPKDA